MMPSGNQHNTHNGSLFDKNTKQNQCNPSELKQQIDELKRVISIHEKEIQTLEKAYEALLQKRNLIAQAQEKLKKVISVKRACGEAVLPKESENLALFQKALTALDKQVAQEDPYRKLKDLHQQLETLENQLVFTNLSNKSSL